MQMSCPRTQHRLFCWLKGLSLNHFIQRNAIIMIIMIINYNDNNNDNDNIDNDNDNNSLISVHPWYGSYPDIKVK